MIHLNQRAWAEYYARVAGMPRWLKIWIVAQLIAVGIARVVGFVTGTPGRALPAPLLISAFLCVITFAWHLRPGPKEPRT